MTPGGITICGANRFSGFTFSLTQLAQIQDSGKSLHSKFPRVRSESLSSDKTVLSHKSQLVPSPAGHICKVSDVIDSIYGLVTCSQKTNDLTGQKINFCNKELMVPGTKIGIRSAQIEE